VSDKPRILLVDDDRQQTMGMRIRLRAAGYDTSVAHDGAAGLNAAMANRPDAIVLDVQMPVMDGMAALAQLGHCEQTRDIPVIMVSASVDNRQAALFGGARYFLEKPYDSKTLIEALERVVQYPGQ